MRRLTSSRIFSRVCCGSSGLLSCSRSTVKDPLMSDEVDIMFEAESIQKENEAKVDAREVLFATGSSGDHRPRMAAQEAFDSALAALPRPPNFCAMHITLDYSAMLDAPQVLWASLCRANNVNPSTEQTNRLCMMGGAVSHQRLGGNGFIQVMLGCIPDLQTNLFTFDAIPTIEEMQGTLQSSSAPPPCAVMVQIDAKLMLQHELALQERLASLGASARASGCVVGGAVYPPVGNAGAQDKKSVASTNDLEESISFLNDQVYRGSAAGVVLRSSLVKAHQVSVYPSIALRSDIVLSGVGVVSEGAPERCLRIERLNDVPAAQYIRDVYSQEALRETSKVFIGLPSNDGSVVPVTFFAKPNESNDIFLLLPHAAKNLVNGSKISLVADDVELDTETAAGELFTLQRKLNERGLVSVDKTITVKREGSRPIAVSSSGAIHFSHRLMNVSAQRDDVVSLGIGNSHAAVSAPSVLQRVLGRSVATSGAYVPGQVIAAGGEVNVTARSSSFIVLEGLK
ncbi:GPI-anchored surface protein, putative [Bodo saltans]|uniref:GPI-anchored surface protein, putative n=1 Tax=Bodo saltans TaxID=75058 RepID=A0A0S4J200_BODSA|nr:GPI-anchored surface protein, putative [Bodo saltans]|eukprot:CUG58021.1 GPI-anchored surface protein, putative [Bodo saltans]